MLSFDCIIATKDNDVHSYGVQLGSQHQLTISKQSRSKPKVTHLATPIFNHR